MIAKIKKGYLVSIVLLIISVLIWSDLSFLFIGFAIGYIRKNYNNRETFVDCSIYIEGVRNC